MVTYKLHTDLIDPIFNLIQVKNYLRVDTIDDDQLITELMKAAYEEAEKYIGQIIAKREWRAIFDTPLENSLFLINNPINEIALVELEDKNNVKTILSNNNYSFDRKKNTIEIFSIPSNIQKIIVQYYAGMLENVNDLSKDLQYAIWAHIASMYDNRGGSSVIPKGSVNIYNNYRIKRL